VLNACGVFTAILTLTFLIEIAIVGVAGLVRGFSGFGAALIMAPGFTLVMAPREAVAMTVLLNVLTVLQLLLPSLRIARWRDIGPMAAGAAFGLLLGSLILSAVDGALMRRAIGIVVLGFSLVMLVGWRYRGGRSLPANLLVGAAAGWLTGAAGIGGPPVILYMLSGDRPIDENRAGFISFFAIIQLVALPVFLWQGLVTWELVWRTALLVPVYLLATHAGAKLFHRTGETLAQRLALSLLMLIGLVTLLR
jgi:uncharacterized membrane protein YfcA